MKIFYQYNLKILALISAILLWFVVITVENNVVKYPDPIDVQVTGLSDYYALATQMPQATVFLKMDADELKAISKADIKVFIDLSLIAEGTHTVDISATLNGSKSKILKVEPANITVTLSTVLEKDVPLQLKLTGQPNQDYIVKKSTLTPETVKIGGAKSVLDQITFIEIPFNLSGSETATFEQDLVIDINKITDQPLVKVNTETVKLKVELESKNLRKEVQIVPIFIREEDRTTFASKLIIEPQTIEIQGSEGIVETIDSIETQPIEVSLLIRNDSVDAKLKFPTGITPVNPDQKVTLKLK